MEMLEDITDSMTAQAAFEGVFRHYEPVLQEFNKQLQRHSLNIGLYTKGYLGGGMIGSEYFFVWIRIDRAERGFWFDDFDGDGDKALQAAMADVLREDAWLCDLVAKYGSDVEGLFSFLSGANRPESYKLLKETYDIEEAE